MESPISIYTKLLLKINKGISGRNISIDLVRFVLLFNDCKNRWVQKALKDKDSILIDSLWEIVRNKTLINPIKGEDYTEFAITEDFYELIGATCVAKKEDCKRKISLREVKNHDKVILMFDENQAPSFEYEWSFCSIQNKFIRIYRKDFDILETTLEYYKNIPDIDIEGYERLDGSPSTNIGIDLSVQYVDQIINLCAEEYTRDFLMEQALQVAKDRTNSQE